MKSLYSILIAIVALFVFAALAAAGPVPTWDKQINGPGRFKVLSQFNDEAVFDKETGLVWEKDMDDTERSWFSALVHCYPKEVGGRKGWRLPTIEELASLVDTSNSSPALPTGHPFTLTSAQEDSFYWSSTTLVNFAGAAWGVTLSFGEVLNDEKDDDHFVWCVRGGQGIDGVQ